LDPFFSSALLFLDLYVILVSRPVGDIKDSDLKVVAASMLEPGEGEALVQNILISIEPTHRIWMSEQVMTSSPPSPTHAR
jgi:NADPH-dependent curcumin reductase CurA